jgi:glycosidase
VDRFNNPSGPPSPATLPCNTYQGGSFEGIKDKLAYLKGRGVGALCLSPVLYNPHNFDHLKKRLCDVIKCNAAPKVLADQFDERRKTLKTIVSSQGDAGKNYVTFLDNHDLNERFHQQNWPKQSRTALLCLFSLQGVPCLYYGHEQGMAGSGDRRE